MLTKFKKWFSVFALALFAIVLVACGEKKPGKPESIEISIDVFEIENGVLKGDTIELSVVTTPENASKEVTWTSSDTSIATVNENGVVTGVKPGKVKIKAVSKLDETVTAEVEIRVYESKNENVVLVNAMNEIMSKIPEYVNDSFQLPRPSNPDVKAEYFDLQGNKHNNNVYTYVYEYDQMETVKVILTYEKQTLEFTVMFNVVADLEFNEFKALEAAAKQLEELLAPYKANKVRGDIELPETYVFGEGDKAVTVTYSYSTDSAVFTSAGVYTRPNDDTQFTLEAYMTVDKVSKVHREKLVANGYNKQEIIEYVKENVFPKEREIQGSNLTLLTRDSKFNTTITWASSNENVLKANGKMNAFLEQDSTVTLTATISYPGTLNSTFAFTEEVSFDVLVKPAVNNAQKVILDFANRVDDMDFPFYFPYGLTSGEGANIIPLPKKVGGTSEFKDVDLVWSCKEAGLFNENWELQKQYLRYHDVVLTYSVTVDGQTATGEVVINVGVTKVPNTLYIGGRFVATNMGGTQTMDGLHTFSKDDGAESNPYGKWNGLTFYIDVEENGVVTRYQYFATDKYTYVAFEGEDGVTVDENGMMTGKVLGQTGDVNPNYQYMLFYNNTSKTVKLPVAYLNYKGTTVEKDVNGNNLIRQVAVAFDGWRIGFITDKDGKVIFGYGKTNIETGLIEEAEVAEDGSYTLPEYLDIPAGGYAWSPFTNQNDLRLSVFTTVGNELTFEKYTPKY